MSDTKRRKRITQPSDYDARQIGRHSPTCHAVDAFQRGDWFTVWGPLDRLSPAVFTTRFLTLPKRKGQRGVSTYCLQFICNSPNCEARLVVRADAALRALCHRGVTGTR
jgi:hypothetical protein